MSDENDFDAAFQEFAVGRDGDVIDGKITDENEDETKVEPTDTVTDTVANTDSDPVDTDAAKTETAPADEFAGWTPEAIAKHKAVIEERDSLIHRVNSDSGRVSALQRKINGLTDEITAMRKNGGKAVPSQNDIAAAMTGSDDDWDKFKNDYPEVANAIDKRMNKGFEAQQNQIKETLAPIQEANAKSQTDKAYSQVAKKYTNWQADVRTQDFNAWLARQPHAVQSLAESDAVEDAISMLDIYDNHRVAKGMTPLERADHAPGKQGVVDDGKNGGDKNTLAERRARQLDAGTTIQSRKAHVNPGDTEAGGDEFERAFTFHANRKDRNRANAG